MSGTTNFLQFNPAAINAENDTIYAADTIRAGGAPTAAILSAPLFNKLAYQLSTFVAAFAQMLANKGYSTSDESLADLVSVLTNVKTSSEFLSAIVTVPYASSVSFDAGASAQFDITLTGDVSSSSLVNQASGQVLAFIVSQDAVGGRSFAWPAALTGPGAVCSVASSASIQMFVVRPSGAVVPLTPILWITSSGIALSDTAVVTVRGSGTVPAGFREITEKADASGGAMTRTFYSATPSHIGRKINIKKWDASQNTVLAAAAAGQYIDGTLPNFPLSRQNDAVTFQCDGTGWVMV